MPGDPLKTFEDINVGDVVMVARKFVDKRTGEDYWWKTFRVVSARGNIRNVETTILRMVIDLDKDVRWISADQPDEVVTLLSPEEMPQGVRAMLMKYHMVVAHREPNPF